MRDRRRTRYAGLSTRFADESKTPVDEPSKGALQRLQQKVEQWQTWMYLNEWQVVSQFVQGDESWVARITISSDFHVGILEMAVDAEESEWDWVVVHELVHLILWPTSALVKTMGAHLDRHQLEILEDQVTDVEETAVNRLTEAIVGERMPVTWSKK